MNTDYYKVFMTVVKTKNISKAAETLGYTQSDVSHIINKLEDHMGMSLLHRHRDGVDVTDQAEKLIPFFENVLYAENQLMQTAWKNFSVEITIASIQSMASVFLPQILNDFSKQNDNIHFKIIEKSTYPEVERLILEGNADCGFSIAPDNSNIDFISLINDDYYVVMPHNHPLSSYDSLNLAQLAEYPFIPPEEGIKNKNLADLISRMSMRRNLHTDTVDDSFTFSMVEKGWGITIAPYLIARLHSSNSSLEIRRLEGDYSRSMGIITHSNMNCFNQLKSFLEFSVAWFSDNSTSL